MVFGVGGTGVTVGPGASDVPGGGPVVSGGTGTVVPGSHSDSPPFSEHTASKVGCVVQI